MSLTQDASTVKLYHRVSVIVTTVDGSVALFLASRSLTEPKYHHSISPLIDLSIPFLRASPSDDHYSSTPISLQYLQPEEEKEQYEEP